MMPTKVLAPDSFSFDGILRPGDHVVCGQTCAEPLTLTRRLIADCACLGTPIHIFIGTLFSDTFEHTPPDVRFISYGAIGKAGSLADRGILDIIPERYSRLGALCEQGSIRADIVLLQVAPGSDGTLSLGLANDYLLDAARKARVVVAEINPDTPWTYGTSWPAGLRVDFWVQAAHPPLELPPPHTDEIALAIARHVAGVIPDGATLQVGVGALPDATLDALSSHRRLGLHSGVLGDAGVRLIRSGAIDNSQKGCDAGISVANTLMGSRDSYAFCHRNREVELRYSRFTHGADVLAPLHRFHAINGALQVDLSGQTGCESIDGVQRGGIGGILDFSRAARASQGGRSISVLPATAASGTISRIVASLGGNPVTIGRSDVDTIVTEYGVAYLRDVSIAERARRLIAIAAPPLREALERDFHAMQRGRGSR